MCLTFRKKERGRDIKKQQQQRFFDRNYWLQLVNKRSNWAYHNRLRSGPCWWAFLHAAIKKRKTKIWWESLFTFMYQQITLRRRRNVTPISNIWKAAPIRLFRVGPQRTQRITVDEFPSNVIGKSTTAFLSGQSWRVLKSWYTGGETKQGLRRRFADELYRGCSKGD